MPQQTVVDALRDRASRHGDRVALTFLQNGETPTDSLTYAGLDARARAIARRLRELGARGQRVLLTYPEGVEYVAGFFGCLYAGAVPVPAYPPNPSRLLRVLPRLVAIVRDAAPVSVLTTSEILACRQAMCEVAPELETLRWVATDELSAADGTDPTLDVRPDDVALLQYTSGSTSAPKGVVVRHRNLAATLRALADDWVDRGTDSVAVSWLPPFHDLGLIFGILCPIVEGFPLYMMSPFAFLQRPYRWLKAMTRYRGSTSAAPNFAYDLCVQSATPEIIAQLDLRSWAMAGIAAEPIRLKTIERFAAKFAGAGFRPDAFSGGYGLAEATLSVSGTNWQRATRTAAVSVPALETGEVRFVAATDPEARALVACGPAGTAAVTEVAVVDPDTMVRCKPDQIGELLLRGPGIADGYWNKAEDTAATFGAKIAGHEASYLRTGDLGFVYEGELFITGRLKELIIIRGRNLYPHDLELTVQNASPALRAGCGAAFSIEGETTESIVVVQEVDTRGGVDLEAVREAAERALVDEHDVMAEIVLVRRGQIPKTSSGKIQRALCRKSYLAGSFERAEPAVLPDRG